MQASYRVLINTFAQYARTIINMCLSLYTVRLVLLALGQSDYGIYSLVAGVVAMLSFVTNSLVTTTQRFVSFYQGKKDLSKVRTVLNNSLVLHLFLGLLVALVLEVVSPFLFDGFLNIPPERTGAAKAIFQTVIAMLFLSFVTSPFRALLISHENIVYISIIDVIDGVIKVVLATLLTYINYDKLILYGLMMMLVQLFNFCAFSIYCYIKYEECCIPNVKKVSVPELKNMLSFAGWSVYSTGCIVGRQQGVAIVLNRWMGSAVNAAYGVAFQIAGHTNFLSSAVVNAIAPQIVKSEGGGDRNRALRLSMTTCKFMFFLLSAVCIPCFFEVDGLLKWWLKDVPENAGLFCQMVLFTLMADSLTVGLAHINQAIGKIGPYSIVINTPKLITVPLVVLLLWLGFSLNIVAVSYVVLEFICALLRIPFIKKTAGLDVPSFIKNTFLKEVIPVSVCVLTCYAVISLVDIKYRFVLTFGLSFCTYFLTIFCCGLTKKERKLVREVLSKISKKVMLK